MKISVIIPAYNEEKYIEKCLDSLIEQNFKDYEIIVILNNCTDNTESIVNGFKNVKIVKEERKGVVYARQAGTLEAKGEIIASADADSLYPKDWLSKIESNFKKDNRIVGLYGPVYLKSESIFLRLITKYLYTLFLYTSKLIGGENVAGINFAFKKDVFDKVNGYNTGLLSAEDIDLAKRIKQFGKIKFSSRLIAYSSDRKFKGRFFKSLFYHLKNYIKVFILKKKPEGMIDIR